MNAADDASVSSPADEGEETLYIRPKADRLRNLNHLVAAVIVAGTVIPSLLASKAHLDLPAAIGALLAVLLVVLILRDLGSPHHVHGSEGFHVGWAEIAAAGFVTYEAWERTHASHHHLSFVILSYVPAIPLLVMGVLEGHMARRRYLRATAGQLDVKLSRRRKFSVPWSEIRSWSDNGKTLTLVLDGAVTRDVPYSKMVEPAAVREWVLQHLARQGVDSPVAERQG